MRNEHAREKLLTKGNQLRHTFCCLISKLFFLSRKLTNNQSLIAKNRFQFKTFWNNWILLSRLKGAWPFFLTVVLNHFKMLHRQLLIQQKFYCQTFYRQQSPRLIGGIYMYVLIYFGCNLNNLNNSKRMFNFTFSQLNPIVGAELTYWLNLSL